MRISDAEAIGVSVFVDVDPVSIKDR